MKCLSCVHLYESDDPGGGSWTGPGSQSVSCGLGKWYMGGSECLIADLRKAVETAESCDKYEAAKADGKDPAKGGAEGG